MSDTREQDRLGDSARAMRREADLVRTSGVLGRSSLLLRLFDYLLAASLEGRAPKEMEIAEALLGRGGEFDGALDGSIRVAVHRLRRKLSDHYAQAAEGEPRLVIPRGSYRLALVQDLESEAEIELPEPEVESRSASRSNRLWVIGLAVLALFAAIGWGLALVERPRGPDYSAAAASPLWASLGSRPTVIVVGDFFIFGETDPHGQVERLIREFSVNSRADLDEYLMFSPEKMGRYRDLHLSYLPTGTAAALRSLVPVIEAAAGPDAPRVRLISMSDLTPAILKSNNIVYVGYLSRLGLLRNATFAASRFEVGNSYDELVDRTTGTRYTADGPTEATSAATRDYGYLATFPGPSGNRVVIVAGTRDAALMQAAESAADPAQVDRAAGAAKGSDAFEALYSVSALGDLNVTAQLSVAGALKTKGIWTENAEGSESFPDQLTLPALPTPPSKR